ncbi:MAG: YggT family protein [Pseudomonadota bacterium]
MLLQQIVSFLLDTVVSLVAGACLLRLLMQRFRVPFGNPVGRLVFALCDWIVLPLRRVIPAAGGWDLASLLAAWLLVLAKMLVLWTLFAGGGFPIVHLLVASVFGLLQLLISVLTAMLLVYAVLSWVQPHSPVMPILDRLCTPMLTPLRRALPQLGGIDFSALVLLVILQVLGMLLGGLQGEVLRMM